MTKYSLYKPIDGAKNFTLGELCRSDTAYKHSIYNVPDTPGLENLIYLAQKVLQPIRDHFGVPLVVTSGYRSPALNRLVKGSPSSFHCYAQAADIRFAHNTPASLLDLFRFIHTTLPYTELIAEELPDGWIHVALAKGRETEKQIKYKLKGIAPVKRATFDEIISILSKGE